MSERFILPFESYLPLASIQGYLGAVHPTVRELRASGFNSRMGVVTAVFLLQLFAFSGGLSFLPPFPFAPILTLKLWINLRKRLILPLEHQDLNRTYTVPDEGE